MQKIDGFAMYGALIACLSLGIGCSREKPVEYVESMPVANEVIIPANLEGAKASTGGIATTVTPSLDVSLLAEALPSESDFSDYQSTIAQEAKNPVPMQDGTRAEFSTITKIFSKSTDSKDVSVQVAITDTRSIPVLTAFINSYSETNEELFVRKRISIHDADAWLTNRKNHIEDLVGFGSITMVYRNRFIIQIDGNLGVSQEELIRFANGIRFDRFN